MRKTLLITMAMLTSVLAFTSCGSNSGANETTTATEANQDETENDTTEESDSEETTFAADTDNSIPTLGSWTDNVYENEFAKLTFTIPGNWTAFNEEEILQFMGISSEPAKESEMKITDEILKHRNITAMLAQNPTTGDTVNLIFQNMSFPFEEEQTTAQDYIDGLKAHLMEAQGMNYRIGEITEQTIGGNTYLVLETKLIETSGKQYFCICKSGNYMIEIIITISANDNVEDVFNWFK